MHPSSLTVAVAVWAWPEASREIERRLLAVGVRCRAARARWRGLKVELRLDVEGTHEQLQALSGFLATRA